MLKLTIFLACACISLCAPAADKPTAYVPIISEEIAVEGNGKFHYSYETGDGIKAHEEGDLKQVDKELVENVSGGFEYTAPDGKVIAVNYHADETGYHPESDVLPVGPPVPEYILKSLKYLEEHPQPKEPELVKKL